MPSNDSNGNNSDRGGVESNGSSTSNKGDDLRGIEKRIEKIEGNIESI
jgi:hypothetical protein